MHKVVQPRAINVDLWDVRQLAEVAMYIDAGDSAKDSEDLETPSGGLPTNEKTEIILLC